MNISVVIPTFNREKYLFNCLNSILLQKKKPIEIIIVDNSKNNKAKNIYKDIKKKFKKKKINLFYFRNKENSGAIARNLGAFKAKGDLIAFLDDDVILERNYYNEIHKVFLTNKDALGVQGIDTSLNHPKKSNILRNLLYKFEKIFMISFFFEKNQQRLLPSLCITNPYPGFKKLIISEWCSTCAGVFSRKVFNKFRFDSQLKKYSWNEYLDFSYSIYLKNPNSLLHTPFAKYCDAQTGQGRLQPKELIYMAEVYDAYIFFKLFKTTFKNVFIYVWSKFGRVLYNVTRILVKKPKEILLIFHCLFAPIYVLINLNKIKNGNLNFFNKTLS